MARSKSRKTSSSGTARTPGFATSQRAFPTSKSAFSSPLNWVDDLRSFDPFSAVRPARLVTGQVASVTVEQSRRPAQKNKVPYQLAFTAPLQTIVCIRRKMRKQVLFAKNKTGVGWKRPRRSKWSSVKCP